MKTELSNEELIIIDNIKEEWISKIHTLKFDKKALDEGIDFIYGLAGFEPPTKIYLDSPLAIQKYANKINNNEKFKYYKFSLYGNIKDYAWIAFYTFFEKIGIINNENFSKFKKFIEGGIYDCIQFDKLCIVSKLPTIINYDDDGNLHSTDGNAIEFGDGFGLKYIHGIIFNEKEYQKYIVNKPTGFEIINEQNTEKKSALIKLYGYESILNNIDHKIIDSYDGISLITKKATHYDLISFKLDTIPLMVISVECHTTHKKTFLGVPDTMKNCIEAIAWTFNMSEKEYKPIVET